MLAIKPAFARYDFARCDIALTRAADLPLT
jgi:hypothetical protein